MPSHSPRQRFDRAGWLHSLADLGPWLWRLIRQPREHRLEPVIRNQLARHASGSGRSAELQRLYDRSATRFERCLLAMLPAVSGEARKRLSLLAMDVGLAARWEEQTRCGRAETRQMAMHRLLQLSWGIADSTLLVALLDEATRIEALLALLRAGERSDVEAAFELALSQPPALRSALADGLRPQALSLAEDALPGVLRSGDSKRMCAALELIEHWGKALFLRDFRPALQHPDAEVRARALRALPYVAALYPLGPEIVRAQEDESPEVRLAACLAAAHAGLACAPPNVAGCKDDTSMTPCNAGPSSAAGGLR